MLIVNLSSGRRVVVEKMTAAIEKPLDPILNIVTTADSPFEGNETATREELARRVEAEFAAGRYAAGLYVRPFGGLVMGNAYPVSEGKLLPDCAGVCFGYDRSENEERSFVAHLEDMLVAVNQYLSGCVFEARVESPTGFSAKTDDAVGDLYAWSEYEVLDFASYELDLTEEEAEEVRTFAGF